GIGLISMMFQPQEKRFGDLLVGTLVIQDQAIHRSVYQHSEDNELLAKNPESNVSARFLTAEEAELINAFLTRQPQLLKADQTMLGAELCEYLSERLQQPIQTQTDLQNLLQQYHTNS